MEEYIKRLDDYKKPNLSNIDEPTSAEYYYDPHSHLSTHEILFNDQTTMSIFRGWIEDNHKFIKDKIVLDVGCGTGVFSILAAKAGAAKVISVESSYIAVHTKKIIEANHFDNVITVIKSNLEEVVLPDGIEKVDTIISMWIGASLFHGGCLKKVLYARDKWLKPQGVIIPDRASLFFAGIADDDFRETRINWWNNVYDYDFSCIIEDSLRYAQLDVVPAQKLVTNLCNIKNVNLRTDNYQDIIREVPFELTAIRNDFVQGFCTFFSVKFSLDVDQQRELNTHPANEPTHWAHTSFYLRDYFMIRKRERIQGSFSIFGVNDDPRFLGVIIGTCFKGAMDEILNVKTFVLRT